MMMLKPMQWAGKPPWWRRAGRVGMGVAGAGRSKRKAIAWGDEAYLMENFSSENTLSGEFFQ